MPSFQTYGKCLAGLLAFGCLFTYVTWPGDDQLDAESCTPRGLIANASAALHGAEFWRVQIEGLRERLREAEEYDQTSARRNAVIAASNRQVRSNLEEIYRRIPSAAPTPSQMVADRLREQADPVELAEVDRMMREYMQKRAEVLARCEQIVLAHVK